MKKYIKPEAKVLHLDCNISLLQGSGKIPTGQSNDFNTGIGDVLDDPTWP